MRRCWKELVILLIQAAAFYVLPLFAGPTDAMGLVFLLLAATLALSLLMGALSGSRGKYLYPAAAALLFLPSLLLYYNGSAAVHALWYLVLGVVGVAAGSLVRRMTLRR